MKKLLLRMSEMVMGVVMMLIPVVATATATMPAYAEKKCVNTAILGENGQSCDEGDGSSVKHILTLVVEIMTVGVGILSVIGISVVGVQYLTAGGDEAKTRKAKMRMFEIVIGVILYVVAYALMNWLIPDFKPFE